MPTIIDSLVVELGFDTEGLEAGRKKVEDAFKKTGQAGTKSGKDIENSAKTAGEFMNRLRNNVLSLFAAFTAGRGIKDFVSGMTSSDAALGRFAKTVNMTVKDVAQWRAAGSLMGIDAKETDSAISSLTQQFQQFALTGDSTVIPYFRSLGIAMADSKGNMKPWGDLMLEISKNFKENGTDGARAVAIMTGMQIPAGWQQMILLGPEAMEEMRASAEKLSQALANDAKPAAERQKAWTNFINQLTTIGVVILTTITPALIALTKAATAFAEWGEEHPHIVGAAFAALTGLVLALSAAISVNLVAAAIGSAVAGFGALIGMVANMGLGLAILTETALPALSEAFLALGIAIEATPIGWVITGIAAISAAGFVLYENWDKIAKWWHRLWGGMADDADDSANKITDAADKIKDPNKPDEDQPQGQPGESSPGQGGGGGTPKKFDGRAQGVGGNSTLEKATNLLKGFEGFTPNAKWDVNAFRAGYGSDTVTDPTTGQVTPVTANTRGVTREQADADLQRRLRDEFIPMVQKAIGPAWNKLSNDTKAAVVSVSYNYGKVPAMVAAAAQTGSGQAVANAINGLRGNNNGINARRRIEESKVALAGYSAPQGAADPNAGLGALPRQPSPANAAPSAGRPATATQAAVIAALQRPGANAAPSAGRPATATQAAVIAALQRPGANAAPSAGTLPATAAGARGGNYNNQTSETRVGEIKVYTQATDAQSIARDLKPALARDTFAQQANFGPV